jgi:hypothetical protein
MPYSKYFYHDFAGERRAGGGQRTERGAFIKNQYMTTKSSTVYLFLVAHVLPGCYNTGYQHDRQYDSNLSVLTKSREYVAKLKCLETTVTSQNCIHKGIKSTLNLGNAYRHAVQNTVSSHLTSRNVQIKILLTN